MKPKIKVRITAMPAISLSIQYAVEILGPVYMGPRIYSISLQEVLVRSLNEETAKTTIFTILENKIVDTYNQNVEHSPLLDMFDDPDRYQKLSAVDFDEVITQANLGD